jgi:nicotinamide mononucleotide transporter
MQAILHKIIEASALSDWLGFIFCILQVVFAYYNKIITYLFGIIGTAITIWVFYQGKLYAEMGVNVYYLIMSIYGWIHWYSHPAQQKALPISTTNTKEKLISCGIIITAYGLLAILLKKYTDSDVPHLDAIVSAFAWGGMWLLAKRKLENWWILNISNFIAIFLLWHKAIYLYSILSVLLFLIAIGGYFNWKKIMAAEKQKA